MHKVWKENFENHDGNKEISEGRRENADAGLWQEVHGGKREEGEDCNQVGFKTL